MLGKIVVFSFMDIAVFASNKFVRKFNVFIFFLIIVYGNGALIITFLGKS